MIASGRKLRKLFPRIARQRPGPALVKRSLDAPGSKDQRYHLFHVISGEENSAGWFKCADSVFLEDGPHHLSRESWGNALRHLGVSVSKVDKSNRCLWHIGTIGQMGRNQKPELSELWGV